MDEDFDEGLESGGRSKDGADDAEYDDEPVLDDDAPGEAALRHHRQHVDDWWEDETDGAAEQRADEGDEEAELGQRRG